MVCRHAPRCDQDGAKAMKAIQHRSYGDYSENRFVDLPQPALCRALGLAGHAGQKGHYKQGSRTDRKESATMTTQTATKSEQAHQNAEKKIQQLRQLYAVSPMGKTALENSISALR